MGENTDWEESVIHVYDFPINNFTKQKICFVEVQFIIFYKLNFKKFTSNSLCLVIDQEGYHLGQIFKHSLNPQKYRQEEPRNNNN